MKKSKKEKWVHPMVKNAMKKIDFDVPEGYVSTAFNATEIVQKYGWGTAFALCASRKRKDKNGSIEPED
ncbi:MAG: hypothetical protein AB7W47_17145 [Calditrichaceae bacterium]